MKAWLVVLVVLAADARRAEACSCSQPAPPCEAYTRASAIFVGKVVEIKTSSGSTQEATFAVTEKLTGSVEDTAVVEGGGMCGSVFEKGKTYVVYASGSSGKFSSSLCGRTRTLDKAKDDLAYARGFAKRTLGVVEGDVVVNNPEGGITRRAGVEVRVRGGKQKARTDKDGHWRLELPPGKYTLDVVDPKAKMTGDTNETVNVVDQTTCELREIPVVWNGRVRGKVSGVDGKPAAGVQLTLIAQGSTRTGNAFTTTDAKGMYEFSGVQAGDYSVVAYSAKGVPTSTFYPGVDDPNQAKVVKLSQSAVVQKIDFKLLP